MAHHSITLAILDFAICIPFKPALAPCHLHGKTKGCTFSALR